MRILKLTLFLIFASTMANAQKLHLNLYGGAMNYQGDLQDKRYTFNQAHLAGGLGLSYDLSDHFAVRADWIIGKVSADDKYGRNSARNLNFTSNITEASLGLQYFLYPVGSHSLTPYAFASLGVYHFSPYTRDTSGAKWFLQPFSTEGEGFVSGKNNYSLTQISIPFGGGVKLALSDKINVGLELGFRKLFTDYLDDVSSTYVDRALLLANRGTKAVELAYRAGELKTGATSTYPPAGTARGSAKNNDWYYFTGITFSFALGSGNGGGETGKNSKYGCPVNVR